MTRDGLRAFAEVCIIAALYAAMTIALGPISYGPIQLRIPEVMKSLVIWRPHLIVAFVIGNFLSNLTSPQVGAWELGFMPFANLVGAALCAAIGRRSAWAGAATYAVVIALAVSAMLSAILHLPFAAVFPPLLVSEAVLIVGGVPLMRRIDRIIDARRGMAREGGGQR